MLGSCRGKGRRRKGVISSQDTVRMSKGTGVSAPLEAEIDEVVPRAHDGFSCYNFRQRAGMGSLRRFQSG